MRQVVNSALWKYLRDIRLKWPIIAVLLVALIGCQAAPPVIRSEVNENEIVVDNTRVSNSTELPVVDLFEFGLSPQSSAATQSLHTKDIVKFTPGLQKARIKVRQVSDLGTRYPTIVVIRDNQFIYNAWKGDGSYDIIWDGTDFGGNYVYKDTLEVNLIKNGSYITAGLHVKQGGAIALNVTQGSNVAAQTIQGLLAALGAVGITLTTTATGTIIVVIAGVSLAALILALGFAGTGTPNPCDPNQFDPDATYVKSTSEVAKGIKQINARADINSSLSQFEICALLANIQGIINATIPNIASGANVVQGLINQLNTFRFNFINQVPAARAALVSAISNLARTNAAAKTGLINAVNNNALTVPRAKALVVEALKAIGAL